MLTSLITDEEDAFESDFESTDEEGAQEDVDAIAEKMVRDEERGTKKVRHPNYHSKTRRTIQWIVQGGRSQLERITAAAHTRHAATFNPQLLAESVKKQTRPRRRVSMGVVVDAVTGEVLDGNSQESVTGKRKSRRMSTILNRTATEHRLRDAERKVCLYFKATSDPEFH